MKKKKTTNANYNIEFENLELEDETTMNLVDADYVYHMEQENIQLRNNNEWFHQENCAMKQEIHRLRAMMMGMLRQWEECEMEMEWR